MESKKNIDELIKYNYKKIKNLIKNKNKIYSNPIEIDKAVFISEPEIINDDIRYRFIEDDKYKYLMFANIIGDNIIDKFYPFSSIDGETWQLCFGAYKNGEKLGIKGMSAYEFAKLYTLSYYNDRGK